MTTELKITSIGDSLGVILPTEMLEKLGVGVGDSLFLAENLTGFEIFSQDPETNPQPDGAAEAAPRDRNLLNISWHDASGESRSLLDIRTRDDSPPSR